MESFWTKFRQEAGLLRIKLGIFCWFRYYISFNRFHSFQWFVLSVMYKDMTVVLKTSWALLVLTNFDIVFLILISRTKLLVPVLQNSPIGVLEWLVGNCQASVHIISKHLKQKFSSVESTMWKVTQSHSCLEFF